MALPGGVPLTFVAPGSRQSALDYERAIATRGEIATRRGNLHDAFNALAWLRFPRAKAALNAVHARAVDAPTANARNRARDAATLLDESGLLLACADPGLEMLLRAHAWRELFWVHRDEVAAAFRPLVLGHGLAVKLMMPYRALTAHALVLNVPLARSAPVSPEGEAKTAAMLDAEASAVIASPGFGPDLLTPLPVAALPGWDTEHLDERLFDDLSVFRPPVLR
jgi:Protein of unknown function (DUF3025)